MEDLFPLESSWIVALAAGVIAIIMLLQLARSLPGQNILMIAASLLAAEGALEYFLAKYAQIEVRGPMWCYLAGSALLWLAVVLSARRVAQFILRPWRRERVYGLWLLGMSAVFTAAFQFGWPGLNLDPDADPIASDRAAIMMAVRALSTVVFLAGLTPWFIRKQPVSRARRSKLAQQPEKEAK
jgi:hypothetical protein